MAPDFSGFSRYYTKPAFFRKMRKINGALLTYAVCLYLILINDKTPVTVKIAITAALGYLVWPYDVIMDGIPIIGYSDDLAVLLSLACALDDYITPEVREKADSWLQ